ncbi:glycosyltransferase [Aeromicrobium sp.]|uniref:glycosyltransferase n=1 Tax=Aeromicrobium sp. TaxID=1871063 RepID=UPI003511D728
MGRPTTVTAWRASLQRQDGGGIRARAFLDALQATGAQVDIVAVGAEAGDKAVAEGRLGRVKREFLPVPLRLRVERELASTAAGGAGLSLVSATHRWVIENMRWSWIDYPDLWSEYAANPTATKGPLARTVSRRQAAIWRARERAEASTANVVTTASWRDAQQLGATWLPTPVWSRRSAAETRVRPTEVAGMLANFDYPPNRVALKRLREVWAPRLRAAGYELVIAGFGSEELGDDDVRSLGPVGSVDEFYDAVGLVLAPVESGGGMKVKVIEALSRGLPVIADDHAVDGLPPSFARAVNLWSDGVDGIRLSDPREHVSEDLDAFSVEHFNARFTELWASSASTP